MDIENIKSQMRKGFLETCTLNLLENRSIYSTELLEHLERAGLLVTEGTIYPLLNRLKKEGFLTYTWQESKQGPPRKYYTLTEEGLKMAQFLKKETLELLDSIYLILHNNYEEKQH